MESGSTFEIIIFPDSGIETEESVIAERDENLSISIISKATLDKLAVEYDPCNREPDRGSENKLYSTIGKVVLRWHKKDAVKSYSETFYVANTATPAAILGASADSSSKELEIHTLGLKKQTADEERQQERRKQDALARRAKEKEEQEKREEQKREEQKRAQKNSEK